MNDATPAGPQPQPAPDALVDARVIAALLGLHPETVARWGRRKKIPAHTLSRKAVRFRPAEVLAALGLSRAVAP